MLLLRPFPKAAAIRYQPVFHNLILLLGFEQLFGAVHVWLVGDSPAGASAVPLM